MKMLYDVRKRISVILLCLLAIIIVSQETSLAYSSTIPLNQSINKQLWTLTRFDMYPGAVATSGQTTRIRAVWLGTQTNGNGVNWMLIRRDPANGEILNISDPIYSQYTHVAIVYAYRNNSTVSHFRNDVRMTNTTTGLSTGEVYNISGGRITTGMIEFHCYNVIIPLDMSRTTNTFRVNTAHVNGTQNYSVSLLRN